MATETGPSGLSAKDKIYIFVVGWMATFMFGVLGIALEFTSNPMYISILEVMENPLGNLVLWLILWFLASRVFGLFDDRTKYQKFG